MVRRTGTLLLILVAVLPMAVKANHKAGVEDPNGDAPNLCPGENCGCQYNCDKKCHCNGLTTKTLDASGDNGPDCKSYWEGKLHCYTDPDVCDDAKNSGSIKMPGTNGEVAAQWSFEACAGVEKPTAAPRSTPDAGHAGVQCTDYDDHDTTVDGVLHKCHWCYDKIDSHEFIAGDWLEASFNVHMDLVQNGNLL